MRCYAREENGTARAGTAVCGVGSRQVADEDGVATFDPLFTWTDPIGAGIV